ncbi:LysR family transcriptional regulator [uncultured Thalassospira sp.]|jgi:DNA-binding transcriptional LysR family regulator|uniref:LysR family transcriptional regulator n=1 Tax=uncultured Thalassospira sp. TaxID=404382 RepID=UPI0030D76F17|tara:strand:- start:15067 stop:15972 length:906 start_codon:yes stop_codon:yes gene_type:complete
MNRFATMQAFVKVIDVGSFSGAAQQLHIGQPAISKAISQLEERLGVRLLLRSTHGLTPTEAGKTFYDRAKRSIEAADEADDAARGAGTALAGRLRICAAVTFARLHLIPRLEGFLDAHPELDIDIVLDDRNIDLIENGIDVALRIGILPDSNLTARKIGENKRLVLASPAYWDKAGIPHTPQDLGKHQAVIYDQRGGGSIWAFRQDEIENVVALKGRVRVTAAEGVREAVFAGLGCAVSSQWMFAPELESGKVIAVLNDWHLPTLDLWAVYPAGRQASTKARAFVSFIEKNLSLRNYSITE